MRLKPQIQDKDWSVLLCILIGYASGVVSILVLNIFDILIFSIDIQDYRLLLSTSATIIATILAVSFSISILGVQHALGNYAPSLLKHFVSDKPTIVCFTILSISSFICLLGLILPHQSLMTSFSLFVLPYSFLVLAYYFSARSKATSVKSLLDILKKNSQKYISKNLDKKLEDEMHAAKKNMFLGPAMKKMDKDHLEVVSNTIFHSSDILGPIQNSVRDVIGLIHRSLAVNDYESVEHGFDTIGDIIESYIGNRREAPEDKIIESLYEQFKSVTVVGIEKKNFFLLKKIVKTYERVALLATTIRLPPTLSHYQFTGLAIVYLNEIFLSVRSFEDIDLEIIHSLRNIAVSSALNGGDDVLSIYYYTKMIDNSGNLKGSPFYREIVAAISQIITTSIENKAGEIVLQQYVHKLTKICFVIITRLQNGDAYVALQPLLDSTILGKYPAFPNNGLVMVSKLIGLKRTVGDDFFARTLEKHAFDSVPVFIGCVISIGNAAIKNKYVWIIRDATILLYKITLSLLEEKYLLELNFDKDIKDIINSISSFFTKFFKTYEDLDFDLFDEILDVLTLMAFHCMKFNKHDLTNLILGNLLTLYSQVATFDKDGYSMVSVAKRIMMIGVLSVEVNAYEVIPKVLELINSLDSNAKTLTRFSPRVTADELETEIKEYDIMFNLSKDTPESYLKGKITDYAWFKFRSMLNNR